MCNHFPKGAAFSPCAICAFSTKQHWACTTELPSVEQCVIGSKRCGLLQIVSGIEGLREGQTGALHALCILCSSVFQIPNWQGIHRTPRVGNTKMQCNAVQIVPPKIPGLYFKLFPTQHKTTRANGGFKLPQMWSCMYACCVQWAISRLDKGVLAFPAQVRRLDELPEKFAKFVEHATCQNVQHATSTIVLVVSVSILVTWACSMDFPLHMCTSTQSLVASKS